MGCFPSKREPERIDIINGQILYGFYEMDIENLKKLPKNRDTWEEISEAMDKKQKEEEMTVITLTKVEIKQGGGFN